MEFAAPCSALMRDETRIYWTGISSVENSWETKA